MTAMEQTLFECQIGVDYPAPIVDHKTQYKIARDRMHNLKKLPQTRQASEQVFQKHGSRKTPMRRR
jgi:deoxyribodipyrimidine photo-lyase